MTRTCVCIRNARGPGTALPNDRPISAVSRNGGRSPVLCVIGSLFPQETTGNVPFWKFIRLFACYPVFFTSRSTGPTITLRSTSSLLLMDAHPADADSRDDLNSVIDSDPALLALSNHSTLSPAQSSEYPSLPQTSAHG
jgi:hypothetical protein